MFKPSKWDLWYDSLPSHTKEWLKKQPVWHDSDMFKAALFGAFIGFLIGICI